MPNPKTIKKAKPRESAKRPVNKAHAAPARSNSKQAIVISLLKQPKEDHDHRNHEGNRLAAAFSARVFGRRHTKEAWAEA
jgi:hypothetical protein